MKRARLTMLVVGALLAGPVAPAGARPESPPRPKATTATPTPAPTPTPTPTPTPAIEPPRDVPFAGPIRLQVDASDVVHRILRVRETIPVRAGPLTLLFPQWTPGDHAPNGPLDQLAGLVVSGGGQRLAWTRDALQVYAFHIEVPAGVSKLDVQYQYLAATDPANGRVLVTSTMLDLQWPTVLLYPAGHYARQLVYAASVTLPTGWSFATALDGARRKGDVVTFAPVALDVLADSPLQAGRYFKQLLLRAGPAPVRLDLVADDPSALVVAPEVVALYQKMLAQADALFGARHYDHYDFLLWLSDDFGPAYYEHHRSGENVSSPAELARWRTAPDGRDRLLHGFVHSWNGLHRLPAEMWTANANQPQRDSLLWVFEGLTMYWQHVLAVRSGLWTQKDALEDWSNTAAAMTTRAGAAWRPLGDVGFDAVIAARKRLAWPSWQRNMFDAYSQGELLWLDVDTRLRELSGGKRSLDDFARSFFGADAAGPREVTYTLADLEAALDAVATDDWHAFFRAQLEDCRPASLAGIERGGYRLVYDEQRPSAIGPGDFTYSIGLRLGAQGRIGEVRWDGPAYRAGLVAGGTITAVNGRPFAVAGGAGLDGLAAAIRAARDGAPLTLSVAYGASTRAYAITWRGGLRYPHLERSAGTPARIDDLLTPTP